MNISLDGHTYQYVNRRLKRVCVCTHVYVIVLTSPLIVYSQRNDINNVQWTY